MKKKGDYNTVVLCVSLLVADFIVVRQLATPSENPSVASLLGFIVAHQLAVPSENLLLLQSRILGVSRTRGIMPSIHFYFI